MVRRRDASRERGLVSAAHPSRRGQTAAPQDEAGGAEAPMACPNRGLMVRRRDASRERGLVSAAHPSRRGQTATPQDEAGGAAAPMACPNRGLMVRRREAPSRTMATGYHGDPR